VTRIERLSDGTRNIKRIPIQLCNDYSAMMCISGNDDLTVYGDMYSDTFAVLVF